MRENSRPPCSSTELAPAYWHVELAPVQLVGEVAKNSARKILTTVRKHPPFSNPAPKSDAATHKNKVYMTM